ncbi:wax ester/triacylglycerol synthase family O-acyltransferase [Curvibacter sp. CHRR-16]|nr:wax ester/triacylglycerol synthase family O-acyltransferase [Curvibacter sp. CHRR-16]
MSQVDTAWLRMDTPSNLMMIVGVWVLRPGLRLAELHQRVQERLLRFTRFTQRVEEDANGAAWVLDAQFDLERHVVQDKLKLRGKTPQQALQQRLGDLAMQPLDRKHPLWQIHLVEQYDGGSAMLVRIHHCMADAVALATVIEALVDGGVAPALPVEKAKNAKHVAPASEEAWLSDLLLKPLVDLAAKGMQKSAASGQSTGVDVGALAYQMLNDLTSLALMPDDSPTLLKGTPGGVKRVAWCPPIALDEVKAVGKALKCSVNDVLLACAGGAIGAYLRERGQDPTGKEIRVMVPVNLREDSYAPQLGNQFGFAPLSLPIAMDNPVERVYTVRDRMNQLKGSTQPALVFGLLAVAGLLIKPAQDALLNLLSRKATAVITNVPGPSRKHSICGRRIEEALFWVPQSGSVGMGVCMLSYGGEVQFGLMTDAGLCPDPQAIIDEFEPEFARLSMVTLMLPWGE